MSVRSGQSVTKVFRTRRFDTGAQTNADSTPTGTLYVNGTADAATVTVTNISTGKYKAAVTLPTLAVGDIVDLDISATVNSVTDGAVVWSDTKDIVIDSAGVVDANLLKFAGTTFTDTSGRVAAAFSTMFNVTSPVFTAQSVNQTGDSYSRIGGGGSGLTSLGDSRLANLDAAVSTRSTLTAVNVWDQASSGHTSAGTFGGLLAAAGNAGDPWQTALPGSYAAGTAGYILGTNLDAQLSPVSTRVLLALPSAAPNANNGLPIITVGGTTLGYTVQTVTTTSTVTSIGGVGQQQIADTILNRNIAGGSSTGRTVKQALASMRNKVAFDVPTAGSFTVYDVDDSTSLWTGTYTSSASADPVVTIDPT